MIKVEDLKFDEDLVASQLFDNGLMLTVDRISKGQDVFITRISTVNGVPFETRTWEGIEEIDKYIDQIGMLTISETNSK
jgi:hypothetical protein